MALREVKVGDVVIVQSCPSGPHSGHEGTLGVVRGVDEHGWTEVALAGGGFCEPHDFVHAPK